MYLGSNRGMIGGLESKGQLEWEKEPLANPLPKAWNSPDVGLARSETGSAFYPSWQLESPYLSARSPSPELTLK